MHPGKVCAACLHLTRSVTLEFRPHAHEMGDDTNHRAVWELGRFVASDCSTAKGRGRAPGHIRRFSTAVSGFDHTTQYGLDRAVAVTWPSLKARALSTIGTLALGEGTDTVHVRGMPTLSANP